MLRAWPLILISLVLGALALACDDDAGQPSTPTSAATPSPATSPVLTPTPMTFPERPEITGRDRCNTRELKAFDRWCKTGGLTGMYEWWIPGAHNKNSRRVPWCSGETALRNLR